MWFFPYFNLLSIHAALESENNAHVPKQYIINQHFFSELLNGDDIAELSHHAEGDELSRDVRERTESDLEIERQVHSLLDQIKQEPSWQYHLTTTDLDEKDNPLIGDSHLGDVAAVDVNGEVDHADIGHMTTEECVEPNGDVNANEVEDVIATDEQVLANKMTGKRMFFDLPVLL